MDFLKDDGVFLPMLNDTGRNSFYKQALDIAAPGKVVCDIGAGTGFLSVLAVQAGASHVFAVERDLKRFDYLNQTIQRLGLTDKIETYSGDFLGSNIHADVYVSETINTQIFGEDMVKLSNHAVTHGGEFIPSGFRIWAEVYENHPVFVLDLSHSEAYDFSPGVGVPDAFKNAINQDFQQQYNLQETVFKANQLNRLFTMLHHFDDLKLVKLSETAPITVDLNKINVEQDISITVPIGMLSNTTPNPMVVIKWEAFYKNIVLSSDQCWFGNIAKPIRQQFQTNPDVTFRYDPTCKQWRLSY